MADHLLKKTRKTTKADLLDELVIEILVRLPAVYLLRCTSVCKSWYSLITSPGFITAQLNKSVTGSEKTNNETLQGWICSFDRAEKRYLLYGEYGRFGEEYSALEYQLENPLGYYRILGCCNGVVCLFIRTGHPNIFLWNPSIRKAINLRMPSMPQGLRKFVLGFGTHPATNECKVIRIAYNMVDSIMSKVPPKVELYTQGTGSWRCICSAPSIHGIGFKWSHTFVNGAVHWLVDDSRRNSIVLFDMGSESFSKMMLPPALTNQYLHLNLFGESLA